jgi:hypothetical protein
VHVERARALAPGVVKSRAVARPALRPGARVASPVATAGQFRPSLPSRQSRKEPPPSDLLSVRPGSYPPGAPGTAPPITPALRPGATFRHHMTGPSRHQFNARRTR